MSNVEKFIYFCIGSLLVVQIYMSFFANCSALGFMPVTALPARCLEVAR